MDLFEIDHDETEEFVIDRSKQILSDLTNGIIDKSEALRLADELMTSIRTLIDLSNISLQDSMKFEVIIVIIKILISKIKNHN
jgi:hypothetical protein